MSAVTQRIPTMSGVFYVYLLFWCLRTSADYIGADLTPPENLTMITLNTNYTLSWGWHQSPAESLSVNFTTQYMAEFRLKYKKKSQIWHTACEKTSQRSCDLTDSDLFYGGIYLLRVQADINGRLSDWSLKKFCPEKDAALGPPKKVNLSPAGSDLDIYISHPVTSTNNSMKDNLPNLYYHILYWESSADTQALRTGTLSSSADMLTLPNLKPWTWYCVSIQSCDDFYNKRSSFSPPHCMQTEGATPWWQIVGYFLVSLSICFLVMLLSIYSCFWCYKTVKATFYPSVQLPSPFQYLWDSSGSDIPRLLTPDSDSELLCDKVTICPEPLVLEINDPAQEALVKPPSGLEPDSSGRPNSQDSSGRRDSGVYSTGSSSGHSSGNSSGNSIGNSIGNSSGHSSGNSSGNSIGNSSGHGIGHSSGLQPPNTKQSSVGGGVSGQGPLDLEQVKMQDMARGLRTELVISDEGIVDMCV